MKNEPKWPQAGDSLIFTGVPLFFYPQFVQVGKFAEDNLVLGQSYEVSKVFVGSSWVTIYIKQFGDQMFNYTFFAPLK